MPSVAYSLLILVKKHQKMKILKRVPSIDFCQKSPKNEDFEKSTTYCFLSKIIKNENFEKGKKLSPGNAQKNL